MGDTIPNCEFMHAHEEIIEKVNASMPDEELLYDLAELYKVFGDSTRIKYSMCCLRAKCAYAILRSFESQHFCNFASASRAETIAACKVSARGQNRFLFACGFSCKLHSCSGNGTRVRINGRNKD